MLLRMPTSTSKTPNVDQLQAQIEQLQQRLLERELDLQKKDAQIESLKSEVDYLSERLEILLSKRFKAQSEQLKYIQGQLFDEAELEQAIEETQKALNDAKRKSNPEAVPDKTPTQPKRNPLPHTLRRVEVVIDLSDEDKHVMGEDWVFIGYDVSEQLAVQQREYFVKQYKRKKYVRKNQPQSTADTAVDSGIKVAPAANVMLPKAIADASLLADVLCSKFIDAMSFYRTHKRLEREGIEIGYSTLCRWPLQLHERLEAFQRLFYEALAQQSLWHLDETLLQVLDEPGRENQTTSYLWGIRAGPPERPIILFHYNARRNYEALEQWLRPCLDDFQGMLVDYDSALKTISIYLSISTPCVKMGCRLR